jgi:hypothetical protein
MSEPTWKKRGCGTTLGLIGLAVLVVRTYLAGESCCWMQRDHSPVFPRK